MVITTGLTLIDANFFFIDVVGLSDPTLSTKTQIKKIEALNKCISECEVYKSTPKEMILLLPTGDGMALGFMQSAEQPLQLAIDLQGKLAEYNKGKIPSEMVQARIGLHSGKVFIVNDIQGNKNIWGPGIIFCRRVMDFGDANHILMSDSMAEELRELSDEYKQMIRVVQQIKIKHGDEMVLYSAYGPGFGNPNVPKKAQEQKSPTAAADAGPDLTTTLYPFIEVYLTIKDPKTMLVKHKRTYEIRNTSDKPIKHVYHGIASDVQKPTLADLKVKVYDEKNLDLKIAQIKIDELYAKEFTTEFNEPVLKDEKGRYYILEYEVEEPERYYENAFLIDCKKLVLKMEYPADGSIKEPVLYEINQETEEKAKSKIIPHIRQAGETNVIRWEKVDLIKGQTYRIEW